MIEKQKMYFYSIVYWFYNKKYLLIDTIMFVVIIIITVHVLIYYSANIPHTYITIIILYNSVIISFI